MAKLALTGKQLRQIGFPESPAISIAINVMEKNYKHSTSAEAIALLEQLLDDPHSFRNHEVLGKIAEALLPPEPSANSVELREKGIAFDVFGAEAIDQNAIHQMHIASKLPIAVAGALMPDAHSGYGLPIGGVLATDNAVIPYGVGVDIGCRMSLSIFAISPKELVAKKEYFLNALNRNTLFGSGARFDKPFNHEVIERSEFSELPLLRMLQGKAWKQLGSSGSGNHFVEFGEVEITDSDSFNGIEPGRYVALLSHSGSRGLGATIAGHYTKLAKDKRKLPGEASNLAWLMLDEDEGREYWMAMNLAGDYASACHNIIHQRIAKEIGERPIGKAENHHNFAWKEMIDGAERIVHRKGATPAGEGVMGIIPGSMTEPGFIVKGKAVASSLSSASHGAGRKMSRTAANHSITHEQLKKALEKSGVTLQGGGLDEAPFAYKDIHAVMAAQRDLVDTVGTFYPKIVRMDGASNQRRKPRKDGVVSDGE